MTSLVTVQEEPPGESCEQGGLAVRSGVDESADGLLQPEEVLSTAYVCNGEPGLDGEAGLSSLVRQEDASVGDCLYGGRGVLSGLDEDGDGYLDDAEVSGSSPVCNGAPGGAVHSSLFEVTEVSPGGLCEAGGYLVETGLDTDDDGLLDPGEVTTSSPVCHGLAGAAGLDGEDGAEGLNSLVATTTEAPGATRPGTCATALMARTGPTGRRAWRASCR